MTDQDRVLNIAFTDDRGNIVGESVEVIAMAGVLGTSMATTIEGNTTPAHLGEEGHWDVPPIRAKPPRRHKHYGTTCAPISKMNLSTVDTLDHRRITNRCSGRPASPHWDTPAREGGRNSCHHCLQRRSSFHAPILGRFASCTQLPER